MIIYFKKINYSVHIKESLKKNDIIRDVLGVLEKLTSFRMYRVFQKN